MEPEQSTRAGSGKGKGRMIDTIVEEESDDGLAHGDALSGNSGTYRLGHTRRGGTTRRHTVLPEWTCTIERGIACLIGFV